MKSERRAAVNVDSFFSEKGGLYRSATLNMVHELMLIHKFIVTVLIQDRYKIEGT